VSEKEGKIWPFTVRTAYLAALVLLVIGLTLFTVSRNVFAWPGEDLERTVLVGIFILGVLPVVLSLVDAVIDRGAVVEVKGVKVDFSQVQRAAMPGAALPANIGVSGLPVSDSGSMEILGALKQATGSSIVTIDLEDGQAWWETRLLVLLAGAQRHGRPKTLVFTATDGGVEDCYQGWGAAEDLFPLLLKAHPQYSVIYHAVRAAAAHWQLVEPVAPHTAAALPAGLTASPLSVKHQHMAFDWNTGQPNQFFAEQMLASELGEKIEQCEPVRNISIVRLKDLFQAVLHQGQIDEAWSSERQLDEFFRSEAPYMAMTRAGQFKLLVSRTAVVNSLVGKLAKSR
jgi:hypothetical protein